MIAQSNVTHMFVGKDADLALITDTRSTLDIGQIGVFKVGSATATGANALTAGDRYTIATKNQSGVVIDSPIITFGSGLATQVDYAAATAEVKAIGYNGTAGSIAVVNSNDYVIHVDWKDNSKTYGQSNSIVKFAAYRSSSAATQSEIADGLAINFNKNFSTEDPRLLKAEVLTDEAGTALSATTGTLTVVNGSKYVTASVDANGEASVGDYLRISGTATTAGVYEIISFPAGGQFIELNMPYQGADEVVGATASEFVTAAAMAASEAGVKVSAIDDQKYFVPGQIKYYNVVFDLQLNEDFGATDVSDLTAGTEGSGTYYQVSEDEWFLKGNRGETWRQGNYPKDIKLEATSGKTYDTTTINFKEANSVTIDRDVLAFGSVIIATEDASSGAVYANLATVLGL